MPEPKINIKLEVPQLISVPHSEITSNKM